jgi:hypothetical protein
VVSFNFFQYILLLLPLSVGIAHSILDLSFLWDGLPAVLPSFRWSSGRSSAVRFVISGYLGQLFFWHSRYMLVPLSSAASYLTYYVGNFFTFLSNFSASFHILYPILLLSEVFPFRKFVVSSLTLLLKFILIINEW